MITHELTQGSKEWHEFRAKHFPASEAAAMLGISPYKSRSQLLREYATGIKPEIDAATQRRFDDGHRFEELARPLAEEIVGQELYPVVGSEGKLSASFDGLTMDETICWEHKTLSAKLATELSNEHISEQYRAQMEQQLMLSGAEKCLFMASSWDGEECTGEMHLWYESDPAMRERILQGWTQFAIDLENYQHVEHAEKPKAEAIMDLPALSVQATGMVTYSNLPEFKAAAEHYISSINTDLQTDQQFADAEATVKFCKSTEETLEVTKKAILAQTATIDEVIRTVDHIQAQLRDKRLMLDKLVKSEKEARKIALVSSVSGQFADHVAGLQAEIAGIRLSMLIVSPDFGAVIKGLKSLASMHDALDTALANAKIEADAVAKDIRAKLAWFKETAASHSALFPDLQSLIAKPMEDFTLTIATRIKEFHEREQAKLEAARAKGEADAKAKAEAAALAELVAKEDQIRAEERAKNNPPQSQAGTLAGAQPEPAAPVAKPDNVVVIEHQDTISAFLASRDFGKEAGRIRAIIIEYVKFEEQFKRKLAA